MVVLSLFLWRRSPKTACFLLFLAWGSLLALSLPVISAKTYSWLEAPYLSPPDFAGTDAQAIVVLGGGRWRNLPEYGADQISTGSLWRVRYAARLAKQLDLPVIASGGTVYPYETISEAAMAAFLLRDELGVKTVWEEGNSRDTWQNAIKTAELAKEEGISNIILVTHAYHMRRSELAFSQTGLDVIAAPTGFRSLSASGWIDDWLPNARSLQRSRVALHEYIGLFYYSLRSNQ